MASGKSSRCQRQNYLRFLWGVLPLVLLLAVPAIADGTPLYTSYYDQSCPKLQDTVKTALLKELQKNNRVGASLLRLHFHDCFVQGCDGSVFLDDTPTFQGEKTAQPNNNSLRGFDAFDDIKAAVEDVCPGVVSCADLIAIIARDAVVFSGGPWWNVELGRRDSLTANFLEANNTFPLAFETVDTLISLFAERGLDSTDLVALTGAHTFGQAQCGPFRQRLYDFDNTGKPDPTLDPAYADYLRSQCPQNGPATTKVNLDQSTPLAFDNAYYHNLQSNRGLLTSDETLELDNSGTASIANYYAANQDKFFDQFSWSIVKMGRISPLTGSEGQIRCNCRKVNS